MLRKKILTYILFIFCIYSSYGQSIFVCGSSNLAKCDVLNCTYKIVGGSQWHMTDIAITPNGKLYGTSDRYLFLIDTLTGTPQQIGEMGAYWPNALVALNDQFLLGAGYDKNLYKISVINAQISLVGNIGYESDGDLTFYKGLLYLTTKYCELIEVKLTSDFNQIVSVKVKGNLIPYYNVFGLATIGDVNCDKLNKLIAFNKKSVYELNPANANMKLLCDNLFPFGVTGATSQVVSTKPQIYAENKIICEGDTLKVGKNKYTKEGMYTDTLISYYDCDSIVNTNLQVIKTRNIFLSLDTFVCFDNGELLTLDGGNANEYLWYPSSETGRYLDVKSEGKYCIETKDSLGCKSDDSIRVKNVCRMIIFVPNAFAPNGENIIFRAYGQNIKYIELKIFSCWGKLIYEGKGGEETSWNGKFHGDLCPEGAYFYSINAKGMHGEIKNLYGLVQLIK